jgi:esterase/lipase
LHSVEVGYAIVQNLCKRVVVGGFSNGAGLALDLAARIEGLAGVIAVSTPLKLQYISTKLVPAVDVWNRLMGRVHFDDARKQFVENHPENPHINYLRNPISGLRELERLMDAVEPRLPDISIPALIIQAYQDPVVSPKGSEIIFERLGSPQKSYMLFNFDRHGILRGEGAEQVHRVIWDFIAHL